MILGLIVGAVCALAVSLKYRFGYDDALDVVGVHMVGGLVGTLLIGLLADGNSPPAGVNGLFYGGGFDQLWRQAVGAFSVMIYSFVLSFVIAKVLDLLIGLRITPDAESEGIDQREHAETAYDLNPFGGRLGRTGLTPFTPDSGAITPTAPPTKEGV